jgi:hypothetical protein
MNERTVRLIAQDEVRRQVVGDLSTIVDKVQNLSHQLLDIKKELIALHSELGELRDTIRNKWWIPLVVSAVTIIVAALIARHV